MLFSAYTMTLRSSTVLAGQTVALGTLCVDTKHYVRRRGNSHKLAAPGVLYSVPCTLSLCILYGRGKIAPV